MYGTIARLRVKEGAEVELRHLSEEFDTLNVPGFVGEYIYQMDADPKEWYLVVLFRDRDSYLRNAESPEQNERYEQFRALLDADPEWHDGAVLHARSPGAA